MRRKRGNEEKLETPEWVFETIPHYTNRKFRENIYTSIFQRIT